MLGATAGKENRRSITGRRRSTRLCQPRWSTGIRDIKPSFLSVGPIHCIVPLSSAVMSARAAAKAGLPRATT